RAPAGAANHRRTLSAALRVELREAGFRLVERSELFARFSGTGGVLLDGVAEARGTGECPASTTDMGPGSGYPGSVAVDCRNLGSGKLRGALLDAGCADGHDAVSVRRSGDAVDFVSGRVAHIHDSAAFDNFLLGDVSAAAGCIAAGGGNSGLAASAKRDRRKCDQSGELQGRGGGSVQRHSFADFFAGVR